MVLFPLLLPCEPRKWPVTCVIASDVIHAENVHWAGPPVLLSPPRREGEGASGALASDSRASVDKVGLAGGQDRKEGVREGTTQPALPPVHVALSVWARNKVCAPDLRPPAVTETSHLDTARDAARAEGPGVTWNDPERIEAS